jgi:hypothetical protein
VLEGSLEEEEDDQDEQQVMENYDCDNQSHIYENTNSLYGASVRRHRNVKPNGQITLNYLPLSNQSSNSTATSSSDTQVLLNSLTSKYYDYVNRSSCLDRVDEPPSQVSKKATVNSKANSVNNDLEKFIITQSNHQNEKSSHGSQFQIPQSLSLQSQHKQQHQQLTKPSNTVHVQQTNKVHKHHVENVHHNHSSGGHHHQIEQRKPMIKIKSANLANQNHYRTYTNNNNIEYDSTIDSAVMNASTHTKKSNLSNSNTNGIDNYNPLMLVKLIHATMDAT